MVYISMVTLLTVVWKSTAGRVSVRTSKLLTAAARAAGGAATVGDDVAPSDLVAERTPAGHAASVSPARRPTTPWGHATGQSFNVRPQS